MAHTTGALQDVLEELAQDEINHMTKFWGFGVWTFPDTGLMRIGRTLIKTRSQNYQRNNLMRTLRRMMGTLNWNAWSLNNKTTLLFTFAYTMHRLCGKWRIQRFISPIFFGQILIEKHFIRLY
jgi:hypothetical protein